MVHRNHIKSQHYLLSSCSSQTEDNLSSTKFLFIHFFLIVAKLIALCVHVLNVLIMHVCLVSSHQWFLSSKLKTVIKLQPLSLQWLRWLYMPHISGLTLYEFVCQWLNLISSSVIHAGVCRKISFLFNVYTIFLYFSSTQGHKWLP